MSNMNPAVTRMSEYWARFGMTIKTPPSTARKTEIQNVMFLGGVSFMVSSPFPDTIDVFSWPHGQVTSLGEWRKIFHYFVCHIDYFDYSTLPPWAGFL
jgi:hypothetical protein